ncbi:MAG: DUF2752 domain-containing protein [Sciscionella sp.]
MVAPGTVIGVGSAAAGALAILDPTHRGVLPVLCPIKLLFGITCPGCGGLRMVHCLLHGNLAGAVHYNALGLLVLPVVVFSVLAWAVRCWRGTDGGSRRGQAQWVPPVLVSRVVIAALIGWTVLRNLPFAPFTALRV